MQLEIYDSGRTPNHRFQLFLQLQEVRGGASIFKQSQACVCGAVRCNDNTREKVLCGGVGASVRAFKEEYIVICVCCIGGTAWSESLSQNL